MEENYELAKWLAGEMSEAELAAFEKTPEYAAYAKIVAYSGQLEAPHFDEKALYHKTISRPKNTSKVIPFYQSKWMRIAAVFVVFLAVSLWYQTTKTSIEIADKGQKTSFALPDNSQIILNSGSEIQYKKWNWDNNRELHLSGEAYFKVAKGKTFEVRTALGKVTVLGTQFNVKVRNNRFDVTCYEGKVKIVHQNQEVIITKGTAVSFDNNTFEKLAISRTKPEWTVNQIVFQKEKLQSILEELQRKYNCDITLKAKENQQLFSGTVPADDLKTALDIVSSTYHLKISKFENKKIILEDF